MLKTVLIYSGFNPRAIIAFLRFAKLHDISCAVVAKSNNDFLFHTDYRDKIIHVRTSTTLDANTILSHAKLARKKSNFEDVFVLPSTEYLNRVLINNKEILFKNGITFGLCEKELYEKISDKEAFTNLCRKHSIPVPPESPIPLTTFPQVAKPKAYFEGANVAAKPIIIKKAEELNDFKSKYQINSFFYQAYIKGQCVYLLFYFEKDGTYSVYSQENFVQQPNGGSMLLAKSADFHENMELVQPYVDLFLTEKFQGLVMVEVKIENGIPYMIEANPRLWGPSQLIIDANMDLFERFANDNNLTKNPINNIDKYLQNIIYFWKDGLTDLPLEKLTYHNFSAHQLDFKLNELEKHDVFNAQK
jgi:predicted ATP-grasp superfamily ATP-dependent carboligase